MKTQKIKPNVQHRYYFQILINKLESNAEAFAKRKKRTGHDRVDRSHMDSFDIC